ncbi:MAG: hypothetical protein R2861_05585 [Desulfobacterales bacterium]
MSEATLPLSGHILHNTGRQSITRSRPHLYQGTKEAQTATRQKCVLFMHRRDSPSVDIRAGSGDGPAIFSGVAFKDIEAYIEVDGGIILLS